MTTMPEDPSPLPEQQPAVRPLRRFGEKPYTVLRIAVLLVLLMLVLFAAVRFQLWKMPEQGKKPLALVNPWNPVSETGYTPKLKEIEEGFLADADCADAAKRLLADCRDAGNSIQIMSAYRSVDDQLVLYDEEVQKLVDEGIPPDYAESEVSRRIAAPGRSEPALGLALDLVDTNFPEMTERQAQTNTARWLKENAWRYGFILRYPEDSETETGYTWHPWHYRYVGEGAAGNIHSLGITLEEYLSMFFSEEASVVYDKS